MSKPEIPIIPFQNRPPFLSSIWLNVTIYFEHLTHKKQLSLLLFYLLFHDYWHILLTFPKIFRSRSFVTIDHLLPWAKLPSSLPGLFIAVIALTSFLSSIFYPLQSIFIKAAGMTE